MFIQTNSREEKRLLSSYFNESKGKKLIRKTPFFFINQVLQTTQTFAWIKQISPEFLTKNDLRQKKVNKKNNSFTKKIKNGPHSHSRQSFEQNPRAITDPLLLVLVFLFFVLKRENKERRLNNIKKYGKKGNFCSEPLSREKKS